MPNSLPVSRQQAQDTIYRYYQQTLQELPEGYAFDGSRYGGSSVVPCNDNDQTQTGPANYSDTRDVVSPSNTSYSQLIAQVGDIWRGWGWRVIERNGFDKPNRFGYAPDGYLFAIKSAGDYYPSIVSESPCFPGDATRFQPVPTARLITRDGAQLDEPSASPTR